MRTLVRYVRDERKNPVGIVVALDENHIGYSLWDENKRVYLIRKFQWDKSYGMRMAIRRAETGIDWSQRLAEKFGILDQHDYDNLACWFQNTSFFAPEELFSTYPCLETDQRLKKLMNAMFTMYKVKQAAPKFFAPKEKQPA